MICNKCGKHDRNTQCLVYHTNGTCDWEYCTCPVELDPRTPGTASTYIKYPRTNFTYEVHHTDWKNPRLQELWYKQMRGEAKMTEEEIREYGIIDSVIEKR